MKTFATEKQLVESGYVLSGYNNDLPVFSQDNRTFVKIKDGAVVSFNKEEPISLNITIQALKNYGVTIIKEEQ